MLLADIDVLVSVKVSVLPERSNWALADKLLPEAPLVPPPLNVMEVAKAMEAKRFKAAKRMVLFGCITYKSQ
jgi:hypothetical protein